MKGGSFCQPAIFNETLKNTKHSVDDLMFEKQIRK